jgi:hypothetical protein
MKIKSSQFDPIHPNQQTYHCLSTNGNYPLLSVNKSKCEQKLFEVNPNCLGNFKHLSSIKNIDLPPTN